MAVAAMDPLKRQHTLEYNQENQEVDKENDHVVEIHSQECRNEAEDQVKLRQKALSPSLWR